MLSSSIEFLLNNELITINNANSPVVTELVTDVSCNGNADGAIDEIKDNITQIICIN